MLVRARESSSSLRDAFARAVRVRERDAEARARDVRRVVLVVVDVSSKSPGKRIRARGSRHAAGVEDEPARERSSSGRPASPDSPKRKTPSSAGSRWLRANASWISERSISLLAWASSGRCSNARLTAPSTSTS